MRLRFLKFLLEILHWFYTQSGYYLQQKNQIQVFADVAKKIGAKRIATGHYADIEETKSSSLAKGRRLEKDQSYFLSGLTQEQLRFSMFPLGEMTKKQVREIAKHYNLVNSEKKAPVGSVLLNGAHSDFIKNSSKTIPEKSKLLTEKPLE